MTKTGIHPTAIVEADLHPSITVGPFTYINAEAKIGTGTSIGSHCVIGASPGEISIGRDSIVRSHTVIYGNCTFSDRLETGHHVTLRENINCGENLRVGTLSDLQGDTALGDYVRLHSSVHIGKFTTLGNYVWIFPYTVITNDPHPPSTAGLVGATIDDYAIITAQCCILPGVRIGKDAMVGAGSTVSRDVPPGTLVLGSPARAIKDLDEVSSISGEPLYPWRRRFHNGYPSSITKTWQDEFEP